MMQSPRVGSADPGPAGQGSHSRCPSGMVSYLLFSTSLGARSALGLDSMFHGLSPFCTMPAWYWHSLHVPTRSSPFQDDQAMQAWNGYQGQQAAFLQTQCEGGAWSVTVHGL